MLMQTDLNNPHCGLRRGGIQNLELLQIDSVRITAANQQSVWEKAGALIDYSLPRSSSMISSVERPGFKIPYSLSIGSLDLACLDMIRRPRSSLTSRTSPARMSSRIRRGLGMVT